MSEDEANPLLQWYTAAELEKLLLPLKDTSPMSQPVDVFSSSKWGVVDEKRNAVNDTKTLLLQNGLSKLEVILGSKIVLNWSANIPEYLRPGGTLDDFENTMDFLLFTMTGMVGRSELVQDRAGIEARLLERTGVSLRDKNDKVMVHYPLGNQFNYAKLAANFCNTTEGLSGFSIDVRKGSFDEIYSLGVNFDVREYRYGQMSLDLKRQDRQQFTCSDKLSEWMLDTISNTASTPEAVTDLTNFLTNIVRTTKIR